MSGIWYLIFLCLDIWTSGYLNIWMFGFWWKTQSDHPPPDFCVVHSWQFVFTCFFESWTSGFSRFVNFGFHLGSILHAFRSAWEPWKWSQNVDESTILTLWTSFFWRPTSRLEFAADCYRSFALLIILGLHLGCLLASEMEVQKNARKRDRKKRNP